MVDGLVFYVSFDWLGVVVESFVLREFLRLNFGLVIRYRGLISDVCYRYGSGEV